MRDWKTRKATGFWPVNKEIKDKTVKTKRNFAGKQKCLTHTKTVSTAGNYIAPRRRNVVTRRLQNFQSNNKKQISDEEKENGIDREKMKRTKNHIERRKYRTLDLAAWL